MTALSDLRWMLPPLAMCLVLTGIHGYLGLHVLSRKVIFVDLALAQIAALGSTVAVLLGYDVREPGDGAVIYLFSLGFTFVGAAVFSLARMRQERVPQEAFIGIAYATASALALLLVAKAPGEAEHIKEMLVGNVLLVTWPQVAKTAAIYSAVGAFHFAFRKPFLEISESPEAAAARGRSLQLWDFLFYASFGFVITSSVAVAGVLLVFSFLVVPAIIAFMFRETIGQRIALAWLVGTICSAAGMLVSYHGDLPTGPSVVVCFAGLLAVASLIHFVREAESRARALLYVGVAVAVATGAAGILSRLKKAPEAHAHPAAMEQMLGALASGSEEQQVDAIHHLEEDKDPHALPALVKVLETATSGLVLEHAIEALPVWGDSATAAVPALQAVARRSDDPFLRLDAIAALLKLKDASGFALLGELLDPDAPLLLEQKAADLLRERTGDDFGLGKSEADAERAQARGRYRQWLATSGAKVRWRKDLQRFE